MTETEKPNSPTQRYVTTDKGDSWLAGHGR